MKNLVIIVMILIPLFWGCSDNNLISPEQPGNGMNKTWIQLPQPDNNLSIETEFSKTQTIDGKVGGVIKIDEQYVGGIHGDVRICAALKFKPGSFSGIQNITMIIDDVNGTVTYSPSMNFNEPATLDLKFEGIDLTGVDPNLVDFVYIDCDGLFYTVEYNDIQVDVEKGFLELKDGLIPHFSRYGWGR